MRFTIPIAAIMAMTAAAATPSASSGSSGSSSSSCSCPVPTIPSTSSLLSGIPLLDLVSTLLGALPLRTHGVMVPSDANITQAQFDGVIACASNQVSKGAAASDSASGNA